VSAPANDSVTINIDELAGRLVDRAEYLAARGDFTSAGLMILARKALALAVANAAPAQEGSAAEQ
jgi:hypothetical protein